MVPGLLSGGHCASRPSRAAAPSERLRLLLCEHTFDIVRWERRGSYRWVGMVGGRQVALVAQVVTAGGEHCYWMAWIDDRSEGGRRLGEFDTAEEAIDAVDAL